jgi:hypothetical protein
MAFERITQTKDHSLRVFSFEKPSTLSKGSRKYVVSSMRNFAKVYLERQVDRHHYELIREGWPCSLYFDMEFEPQYNAGLDGNRALSILLDRLIVDLKKTFDLDISRGSIIDLESSSASKFSHHIIVKPCVFVNNVDMGLYVKHWILQLYSSLKQENEASGETGESLFHMLFPVNADGERRPMIDAAVYTKNRNFRLWKSSKLGKETTLEVGPLNGWPFSPQDPHGFFFDTLLCNIPFDLPPEKHLTFADRAKEVYKSSIFGDLAKTGPPTIPAALGVKVPGKFAGGNANMTVKIGDAALGVESPFPNLDFWIRDELRSWPGSERPIMRGWRYVEDLGQLTYNIGGNKWCERIQREHKSNHIFIVCDLKSRLWYQSCHDPDCKTARSTKCLGESFGALSRILDDGGLQEKANFVPSRRPIPWDVELDGYDPFSHLDDAILYGNIDPDELASRERKKRRLEDGTRTRDAEKLEPRKKVAKFGESTLEASEATVETSFLEQNGNTCHWSPLLQIDGGPDRREEDESSRQNVQMMNRRPFTIFGLRGSFEDRSHCEISQRIMVDEANILMTSHGRVLDDPHGEEERNESGTIAGSSHSDVPKRRLDQQHPRVPSGFGDSTEELVDEEDDWLAYFDPDQAAKHTLKER